MSGQTFAGLESVFSHPTIHFICMLNFIRFSITFVSAADLPYVLGMSAFTLESNVLRVRLSGLLVGCFMVVHI